MTALQSPEIGPSQPFQFDFYDSLLDLFDQSLHKYASRPACVCMGKTMSYAQLDRLSKNLANWLATKIQPGDRVAIMMPNLPQYLVSLVGILRAGAVVVNVNPLYSADELEYQLKDSGAKGIIILENFVNVLQKVIERTQIEHVVVTSIGDLLGFKGSLIDFLTKNIQRTVPAWTLQSFSRFSKIINSQEAPTAPRPKLSRNDLALLQYTGGTMGTPKGVMLSHANLSANVLQLYSFLQPLFEQKNPVQLEAKSTLAALPLYHIFGFTACGLLMLHAGFCSVLIPNPKDLQSLIKALRDHPVHFFPGVNTLFKNLLNHPEFHKLDFSSLIAAQGGAMTTEESVAKAWFKATGVPIIDGYGLSEASPCLCCQPISVQEFSGTVGSPLPATELVIKDETGTILPTGEEGEVCARGPQVMQGYWNQNEETELAFDQEGFLRTGDIGILDERGLLKLLDRKKDLINVSGFKVHPSQVEACLLNHPGVLDAAAVAIPDEHSGEAVKLFIVKKNPDLSTQNISDFCREHLVAYKRPKAIEFCSEIPKSAIGKVLRKNLKQRHPSGVLEPANS